MIRLLVPGMIGASAGYLGANNPHQLKITLAAIGGGAAMAGLALLSVWAFMEEFE